MTLLANLLVIGLAHCGEPGLAWLRSLPDDYLTKKQTVSYAGLFDDVGADAWYASSVDYVKYGRLMYGTGHDAQMTPCSRRCSYANLRVIMSAPFTDGRQLSV